MCVGECTCTKILSWIFRCCHARRDCGTEFCGLPMEPVNAARKDLSDKCRVQWVLTKPQGSGASQARHHRKKQHRGAMVPPTANLNGKGRKKRPKSKVKLTGKGKQNQKLQKNNAYYGTDPVTVRASSGSCFRSAKRLRMGVDASNKIYILTFAI